MTAATCRHCGVSLAGPGNTRREIGYIARDRIQFWICLDCGGTWPAYPAGHSRHERAEQWRADYETTAVRPVGGRDGQRSTTRTTN